MPIEDQEPDPSVKNIEDDWLYAWRENAGRVSSEELQKLWGQVLAGEVKNPGSCSLRAMDFLRALSKQEAQLINKIAPFNMYDFIPKHNMNLFLEKIGVTYYDLMNLQNIGINIRCW